MIENNKGKTVNPAVVEHMAMENERLRGLLRDVRVLLANSSYKISGTAAFLSSIDAALSQQAELTGPGLAFALTGGRHGEPDEPAPAQDERHSGLLERIDAAIKAFTSGRASMHVPPEPTDVDFVLEECRKFIVATRPAQTEQQPSTTQQVLDLILEECRYWQGRDEARRGGFACLYAQAKEIVDNAAPVANAAPQPAAMVDANDDGMWADILPDVSVKVGQMLYSAPIAQTAPQPEQSGLVDALTQLLCWAEKQVCTHEETHRGGAIWEICDGCGAKWADDEGGRPTFVWPKAISNASAALSAQGASK